MSNKIKNLDEKELGISKRNLSLARGVSLLMTVAVIFLVSLLITVSVDKNATSEIKGILFVIDTLMIVGSVVLTKIHGNMYSTNLSKKLDERLTMMRRKVFEASFIILTAGLFLTMFIVMFVGYGSDNGFTLYFSAERDNIFSLGLLFYVLSLPAIVASWNKNG